AYAFLFWYNVAELRKLQRRGSNNNVYDGYSLSRSYQLRENVIVMKMLLRIAAPFFTAMLPAMVFYGLFVGLPITSDYELVRALGVSLFDWWIDLVCGVTAIRYPFFDDRFRRAAGRMCSCSKLLQLRSRHDKRACKVDNRQITDAYFNWLEEDLR
ncbi:hypothetical protein PFISCL1PPCAC_13311, partial [Pristionchus fissidentatus]